MAKMSLRRPSYRPAQRWLAVAASMSCAFTRTRSPPLPYAALKNVADAKLAADGANIYGFPLCSRHPADPALAGRDPHGFRLRGRLRMERQPLRLSLADREGDHRDYLERLDI